MTALFTASATVRPDNEKLNHQSKEEKKNPNAATRAGISGSISIKRQRRRRVTISGENNNLVSRGLPQMLAHIIEDETAVCPQLSKPIIPP